MYSNKIVEVLSDAIENQVHAMTREFTSETFCLGLEGQYQEECETLIRHYMSRGHDRPHAIQAFHSMLMHTVNARFSHLAHKIRTIDNPKGGQMSLWRRT